MKAIPIRSVGGANKLPTPTVNTLHAQEPVDLNPAGNTVSITTTAQNPFTQGRPVSVTTQASGGMAKAPGSMQSSRLLHSFIPGIGENPNAANQGTPMLAGLGANGTVSTVATATTDIANAIKEGAIAPYQAEIAANEAKAEVARAQAAGDMARAQEAAARYEMLIAAMGGAGGARKLSTGLLVGGVALLGIAGYMMTRNKKKGRRATGRRRR
jgi:hypothetical protein